MERFLNHFVPELYDLELFLFRKKELLRGTVRVEGEIIGDKVKFHAVNLRIQEVSFQALHWRGSDITPLRSCDYYYDDQTLEIPINAEMQDELEKVSQINQEEDYETRRLATFTIKYETSLNHNMQGCYLSTYDYNGEEQRLIATQFESHYAREAFPCIDEPAAKAKFSLTLLVPDYTEKDVVLANTPLLAKDCNRFTFQTTPRMSTYLLAWVIGPLQSISMVNKNGVKVSSYCALNQPAESLFFANNTAARALEYYDERFREKYPLPKLDQVALPDFEAGAMENWGLVTYRESMMLADKTATLETKQSIALTVTHELSHQWFGDLVTMQWWDDLWLNESFASVIEYYATAALYPEFNIWQDFFTGYCFAALRRDCLPGVQAVHQPVDHPAEIATLFDSAIVYAKGAHLIFMLIRLMGEEKFNQGICDYFDKHKYSNTEGNDLWESLQPHADFDIEGFMHAWITKPGYPVLQKQGDEWRQHRFLVTGGIDESKWPLPKISDDMSGHYLIDLSNEEFQQKLSNFDNLSLEQRLRLLIDRELLAKTPHVPSSSLLDLLPKFVDETSGAVWNILVMLISDLKLFCPPETPADANYKAYLIKLLQPQFDAIDYSELHDVDSTTKRGILLGIARYCEYDPVLHHLNDFYQGDFAQISPELRTHVLAAKLYYDENEVFDAWLAKYQIETDPEIQSDILYTLAGFSREPQNLEKLLTLLEQPKIVRPQDHIFLFIHLLRNFRTRDRALDWLIQHWDYVEKLTGEKSIEDYVRYAANLIRTSAEAEKFYNFFDSKMDDPVISRAVQIAHTDIDARLALIAKDSTDVQEKLKELVKGK